MQNIQLFFRKKKPYKSWRVLYFAESEKCKKPGSARLKWACLCGGGRGGVRVFWGPRRGGDVGRGKGWGTFLLNAEVSGRRRGTCLLRTEERRRGWATCWGLMRGAVGFEPGSGVWGLIGQKSLLDRTTAQLLGCGGATRIHSSLSVDVALCWCFGAPCAHMDWWCYFAVFACKLEYSKSSLLSFPPLISHFYRLWCSLSRGE